MTTATDKNAQLLKAGALLPAKAKLPGDSRTDTVSARVYGHPALGDRPVVRLVPDTLSRGEDIGLGHIGFSAPRVVAELALRRRQALGFPGWALVNDPERAGFALDVMKEFRKEARRARSKPGHARDGFEAIARRLTRSVPHFLPSFYEEAGRAFLEENNTHYAAQCFGKARAVEKIHALKINEAERKQSFIEFALAGAVTIKALTEYARDLQKGHDPAVAYEHFSELALRRTMGGLPPWASMARDMRKLAKAAGLDLDAEDRRLLAEIIETSSITRAPKQFWISYEKALAALVGADPRFKRRLLSIFPEPPGDDDKVAPWWLGYLEQTGVLQEWDRAAGGDQAPPAGGWLSKMLDMSTRGWGNPGAHDELFAQLRRMDGRLKAEGVPVRMSIDRYNEIEVDLCDLALELGVPVADPGEEDSVDLGDWARAAAEDSAEHPRDPTHMAGDARFVKMLESAVESHVGGEPFETAARGKTAFAELRRRWLLRLVDPPAESLPGLAAVLDRLEGSTTVETFVEFPEARPPLEAITVADRLGRLLRGGFIGELCWNDLEAACAELEPKKDEKLAFHGAFPFIVATDQRRAIVVGPAGRTFEHDLRLPRGATLRYLQWVDDQLLVSYRTKDWDQRGYWTSNPSRVLKMEHEGYYDGGPKGRQLPLPGGGAHLGGGPLRPGDNKVPTANDQVICDGETFWRRAEKDDRAILVEFDPLTNEKGRASLPRFLEDFAAPDTELDLGDSYLVPAPAGLTRSPVGTRDGLLGWRARRPRIEPDAVTDSEDASRAMSAGCCFESVDGTRFTGSLGEERRRPDALLQLPGGGPLPVDITGYQDYDDLEWTYALWDPTGEMTLSVATNETSGGDYSRGAPLVLPLNYWHLYRPRDEAGSIALRSLADRQAGALLEAARIDIEKAEDLATTTLERAVAAVEEQLPRITDSGLRLAVAGVAATAAWLTRRQEELLRARDPDNPEAAHAAEEDDGGEKLNNLLGLLIEDAYYSSDMFTQIRSVGAFFARQEKRKVPSCSAQWPDLIGHMGAAAFFAPTHAVTDEQRSALLDLLEIWAGSPFVERTGSFRYVTCTLKRSRIPFALEGESKWQDWGVGEHEGNRYFLTDIDTDEEDQSGIKVLEYSPAGAFKLLPSAKLEDRPRKPSGQGWATPDRLRALAEVVRERGTRPFDRAAAESLAERTGMSYAEAALLLSGMPNFRAWEKNFLPRELRTEMGLKVKEADAARSALKEIDQARLQVILDAAMPGDPAALYDPLGAGPDDEDSFIARLARAWSAEMGQRISLDPQLLAQVESDVGFVLRAAQMLPVLTDPSDEPRLTCDGAWEIGRWGGLNNTSKREAVFDDDMLLATCAYISYLHGELPAGHPLLGNLPAVHDLAMKRLTSSKMLLGGGFIHLGNKAKNYAFVESIGGESFKPKGKKIKKSDHGRDSGTLLALPDSDGDGVYLAFRPARIVDWVELNKLASWSNWNGTNPARAAELMFIGRIEQIASRAASSPLPEGSWEANPLLSAPEVVAEVSGDRGLSGDAAILYLQLLALPGPTTKKLQRYNDWKPARLRKAGKELLEAGLVIEARRPRAGRSLFLPGGWEQIGAPNLPIETWKLPLFGVQHDKEGRLQIPLGRILPVRPLHVLFEQVWSRVQSGDVPRYEEVK